MYKELKLICETDFNDYEIMIEQQNPNKPKQIKITGPYIVSEQKNANGRIYPKTLMEKSISDFMAFVKGRRAMGELDHPPHTEIDPHKVCHLITDLKQDNNIWIGESVILSTSADGTIKGTPNGDILASIVQHGGKIGMSTRGVGEVTDKGLVTDYKMITVDAVTNPSGPNCFIEGILYEKKFMIDTHGDIIEYSYNNLQSGLENLPKHNKNEYIYNLFENFIRDINTNNLKL